MISMKPWPDELLWNVRNKLTDILIGDQDGLVAQAIRVTSPSLEHLDAVLQSR